MKKILGLDLGTTSIGWALVNEADHESEESSIIKLGVRVNPLTVDELSNFDRGKSITTNADRTLKRSMRRNLQRYKLRREELIRVLKDSGFIKNETILSENGNKSTFETYRLRAKAVTEEISLEEFSRVLIMINKKRGYKSSRKVKNQDEGQLIDGMEIAKKLYEENLTPGQLVLQILKEGKKYIPEFYRSDLQEEFDVIWKFQKQFHPQILSDDFKTQISGKGKLNTAKIFLGKFGIYTLDNKGADKRRQSFSLRVSALSMELSKEELAFVISDLNGIISNSSGYLGSISDRSKELYFNKQTVGQYLMDQLIIYPHVRLKNKVFYRQDYLDEFNAIWENQSLFHKELTSELKAKIRDIIIFYQRKLKSQKGLISFCEFESKQVEILFEGKKKTVRVGSRVCPRSSPLFQVFKIWQNLNNVIVSEKNHKDGRFLEQDEKELLFKELSIKKKLSKVDALSLLFPDNIELDFNCKDFQGNNTQASLFEVYQKIISQSGHGEYDFSKMSSNEVIQLVKSVFEALKFNTEILFFNPLTEGKYLEKQEMYRLWHLLYSFEGDSSKIGNEKLINIISENFGFEKEYASLLANVVLDQDYSSLSTKAIRRIIPYLIEGNVYSTACQYAGYNHSKSSLTIEERNGKRLLDKLKTLPKNSLRNPVVEKILNQMINVVNSIVDVYGKPDEIRIELARELKKSAKEREDLSLFMNKSAIEHQTYKEVLKNEYGLTNVSRNDIIRYKLYLELEQRGYKTLYSNTYIPKEKLFSKEFDIEHIIPQSRLFDDSFSNKILESRSVNIEKGNDTAYDYVHTKEGDSGLDDYLIRIEDLLRSGKISKTKFNKLKMKGKDIPDDFIARDLRDTQYIAKMAKTILEELVREVNSTTGSITDRLREDWQLIDVMQELNWDKFNSLGMTEIVENREGKKIRRIKEWTKRNDHRHHAMDALTIAFTKISYIQYLNNLNARSDRGGSIYGIESKELYHDEKGKLKFKPPIPLNDFRAEAKKQLGNVLVSIKAKNKVATTNVNSTRTKEKTKNKRTKQLTPRGQLHLETIYGSKLHYVWKDEKIGAGFDKEKIATVAKPTYRTALLNRLIEFDNDPKKAFTGKNNLEKNPLFLDSNKTLRIPEKVKIVTQETLYTIRKEISPDLKVEKVIDQKIRTVLETRLKEFSGDNKRAFTNLDENPIWLNKEKGISIKRVTISGIRNVQSLHDKKDKEGNLILDKNGNTQPVDFVNTGNNHHVAIYRDEKGNLQDNVVSFFEAMTRLNQGLSIVEKDYKKSEGWVFLFSIKQNEFFVFPNEKTGFDPSEIDLLNSDNCHLISPNLYRVQKFSKLTYGNSSVREYVFRHHLETSINDNKALKEIAYKNVKSLSIFEDVVKVRINHIGQIVSIGEY